MFVQPDHTKPTIAFLIVCVMAAATIGTGLARQGEAQDVVAAGDRPGGVIAVPDQPAPAEPAPAVESWDFDLARVVTLTPAPTEDASQRPRPVRSAAATGTATPVVWRSSAGQASTGSKAPGTRATTGSRSSGSTGSSGGSTKTRPARGSGGSAGAPQPQTTSAGKGKGLAKGRSGTAAGSHPARTKRSAQRVTTTATSGGSGRGHGYGRVNGHGQAHGRR